MKSILSISCNDQGISWGPAVHFLELWSAFTYLFPLDYHVRGLAPSWTGRECILPPRFELTRISVPGIPRFRQIVFDLAAAGQILCCRSDVVYLRLSSFHLFTILALALKGKPYVVELNGISDADSRSGGKAGWYRRLAAWQHRRLIRRCAAAVAVSRSIAEHAFSTGARYVRVIQNRVSPDLFQVPQKPYQPDSVTVLYVGTYTPWDGADRIPSLAGSFPQIAFWMVGDGERRPEIQRNSPKNVRFLGTVDYSRLREYYRQADAGIVLYEEGRHRLVEVSSLKSLEYMAAGLPIFSTDVPGQEFIREHNIGVLSPISRLEEGFTGFLQRLQQLKANVDRYRSTHKRQYSWQGAARETEQVILHVIDEDGMN